MNSIKMSKYMEAGVNVNAGYKSVELIKNYAAKTIIEGVLEGPGGFGAIFAPNLSGLVNPVLISGTDGVGTKLKIAFLLDKHDTVGIDCVAMCCNDIVCHGAKPLFFLDYIACGHNIPEKIAAIVLGIADGCILAGCALIGGETAEHPGLMPEDEYDLAGFMVGIADKNNLIKHEAVCGDVILGLPSSGVHSNGFSLIRKIFSEEVLKGELGEELLTPTKIYVKPILSLLEKIKIKGAAHITGGGFFENIPRMLPHNVLARIEKSAIKKPEIFEKIKKTGNINDVDMWGTFNMGVGMAIVVSKNDVDTAIEILKQNSVNSYIIGDIIENKNNYSEGIILC